MTKLKGVCIGAGYFSQFHFEAWNRIDNVEILGVYDQIREKAERAAQVYQFAKVYENIEEMFLKEKPDFVDIITPPDTHLGICLLALKHNIHIICQKPLAPKLTEADEIVQAVKNTNVRMMVHENFRFQPWYREIKNILSDSELEGQLHTLNFRMRTGDGWQKNAYLDRQPYFREMERLLIFETGIHFIDTFRFLGGEISKVYAQLKRLNPEIKGEDFGWVHFEFEQGGLGFLDANRYNESTSENPRLTFGSLQLETNKGTIRLYEDGSITTQLLGTKEKKHPYAFQNENFAGDCVYNTQLHFTENLINDRPFETDIAAYMRNLLIQEAIYSSNDKGIPIDINKMSF